MNTHFELKGPNENVTLRYTGDKNERIDGILRLAENVLKNTEEIERIKKDVSTLLNSDDGLDGEVCFDIVKNAALFAISLVKLKVKTKIDDIKRMTVMY